MRAPGDFRARASPHSKTKRQETPRYEFRQRTMYAALDRPPTARKPARPAAADRTKLPKLPRGGEKEWPPGSTSSPGYCQKILLYESPTKIRGECHEASVQAEPKQRSLLARKAKRTICRRQKEFRGRGIQAHGLRRPRSRQRWTATTGVWSWAASEKSWNRAAACRFATRRCWEPLPSPTCRSRQESAAHCRKKCGDNKRSGR